MGSEILKHNHLKSGQLSAILFKKKKHLRSGQKCPDLEWSDFQRVWTIAIARGPLESRTIWNLDLQKVWIWNVQISDPLILTIDTGSLLLWSPKNVLKCCVKLERCEIYTRELKNLNVNQSWLISLRKNLTFIRYVNSLVDSLKILWNIFCVGWRQNHYMPMAFFTAL